MPRCSCWRKTHATMPGRGNARSVISARARLLLMGELSQAWGGLHYRELWLAGVNCELINAELEETEKSNRFNERVDRSQFVRHREEYREY
ncbi:hypothetical protein ElyMa_005076200 [Elysia marginata]|uniref:Uncharacterized protein n=1 Tax=Elysia marginata TaxID=1093978 RepID=A0AAV4JEE2_9GAST|nr:hypothetical protein ElyMa_005076200 [Elysia marginata]